MAATASGWDQPKCESSLRSVGRDQKCVAWHWIAQSLIVALAQLPASCELVTCMCSQCCCMCVCVVCARRRWVRDGSSSRQMPHGGMHAACRGELVCAACLRASFMRMPWAVAGFCVAVFPHSFAGYCNSLPIGRDRLSAMCIVVLCLAIAFRARRRCVSSVAVFMRTCAFRSGVNSTPMRRAGGSAEIGAQRSHSFGIPSLAFMTSLRSLPLGGFLVGVRLAT